MDSAIQSHGDTGAGRNGILRLNATQVVRQCRAGCMGRRDGDTGHGGVVSAEAAGWERIRWAWTQESIWPWHRKFTSSISSRRGGVGETHPASCSGLSSSSNHRPYNRGAKRSDSIVGIEAVLDSAPIVQQDTAHTVADIELMLRLLFRPLVSMLLHGKGPEYW